MSTWGVLGAGVYQEEVCIYAGVSVSAELGGASLWSMSKTLAIFAGFERKASIPALKHNSFVDS